MPGVVALLLTLALLPAGGIRWVSWFGGLAERLVTPISHPLAKVSRWVWPASARIDDKQMQWLSDERERFAQLALREQADNARLRQIIKELQRGLELNPALPVRQLAASVIRVSSDLSSRELVVRAGEREGVIPGTVATCAGLQLLGRVVDAGRVTSRVQPITAKAAKSIRAMVMLSETATDGRICTLEPVGDGTLRGPVQDESGTPQVAIGMTVRLDDPDRWPGSAQMLLIGKVEAIEPDANQPLRRVLTVRPSVLLDRVSEVYLRLEDEPNAGGRP